MKNLLIYTNCQGVEIKKYLESINSFNEDYRVISVFMPHWFNDSSVLNGGVNEMKILPNGLKDLLKTIDIFIYQPFSPRRGIFSTTGTNSILNYLNKHCKKISFPSLYADIFPLYTEGSYIKGLSTIENLIQNGYSNSEIINLYYSGQLNFDLQSRFDFCLEFMKTKELSCDISASDFIKENIKKYRLFDTQNHPSEILIGYVVNQILEILNIDRKLDIFKIKRYIINSTCYSDSIYMSQELKLEYIKNDLEQSYLALLEDYLENPKKYKTLDKNKTCYQ